jgi:hypothetical protein
MFSSPAKPVSKLLENILYVDYFLFIFSLFFEVVIQLFLIRGSNKKGQRSIGIQKGLFHQFCGTFWWNLLLNIFPKISCVTFWANFLISKKIGWCYGIIPSVNYGHFSRAAGFWNKNQFKTSDMKKKQR